MRRLIVLSLLAISPVASAVPLELNHQGRLFDDSGLALDGDIDVAFSLWDAQTSGSELWTETITTSFDDGYFSERLGQTSTLDDTVFDGTTLYLQLEVVGGAGPTGRIAVVSVPYAIRAQTATAVDGTVDWTQIENAPAAATDTLQALTCGSGEAAVFDGLDWQCASLPVVHQHDANDLSSGVVDAQRLPIGTGSSEIASGDHLHNLAALSGTLDPSALPTHSHAAGDLSALPTHSHAAGDLSALPSHSHGAGDLGALPSHTHDVSDLTGGPLPVGMIPVGTTASTVAAGSHGHDYADLTGDLVVPASTATCSGGNLGALRWNTDALEVCGNNGWYAIYSDMVGDDPTNPGLSCKDIRDNVSGAADGLYWIDPDGGAAGNSYQAWCDMSRFGGGWTRLADVGVATYSLTATSYTNGVGSVGDAVYIDPCANLGQLAARPDVMVVMGSVTDFFRPISSSDLCGMLTTYTNHLWSSSPSGYIDPPNYSAHLGGSQVNWPLSNVSGDDRRYLSFWGGGGAQAGCCHNSYTDGSAWSRTFELYVRE